MELRQLRYAVTVAEELHFGRAAERLLVAQPSLSRQIRDLERDLGVTLFRRTSRRVELTAAGAEFIRHAQRTIAAAESTREATLAAAAGISGRVTLGFVASAAVQILPELMRNHRSHRPGVRVNLREMTTEEQVVALDDREIDVGLSRDLESEDRLVVRTLFSEPLLAVVPQSHPLRRRRRIGLAELAGSRFVTLPRTRVPRAWDRLTGLAHAEGIRLHFAQEANQFATLLALVAADVGVAVVPSSVRTLRHDGVHYVELRDRGASSEVQAAMRTGETSPTAVELHQLLVDTRWSAGFA